MIQIKPLSDFHEIQHTERSIIGKWANLRDNWLRYWRKRQELLRVGSSTKSLKKYIHHDQLLFLSKVYDPEGQQEVEEIQVEVDVISDPEFESTVEFDETSQNSWNTPQYQPVIAPLPPQDQTERHLYFFHSIMPLICDFDDNQILEFHAGVLELVKRVKRRELITLQNCQSSHSQGVQELGVDRGFFRMKSEAAIQSDCACKLTQQILVNKEPNSDFSQVISNSTIPESTSTSSLPEVISHLEENEIKQKISFDKSEILSLKNVVAKLEKISKTLDARVVVNNQDQFSSLLTQLPPKKIQSLKRKIVKEVVRQGFKKIKVESMKRCLKSEKSNRSLDVDLQHTLGVSERKTNLIKLSSSEELEVAPSILRDTLQH